MKAIKRTRISDLLKNGQAGVEVNVRGWVRTRRSSKQVAFVALNDGSTINNVQVVIDIDKFDEEFVKQFTTGACLSVNGMLVESIGGGQSVEIQATEIELLGGCDNTYPLQKKGQTMEFMRTVAHLRPRTNTFGAVFRIRHNMAYAIHKFFHDKGFYYFHTPLITASDCEGAGQMFQVTTMNLYDLKKDENGRCYFGDEQIGYMVYTSVTAGGLTYEMWLPVMDNNNKAMKLNAYTYATRSGDKSVEAVSMFDINKAVMRCLVKNLAMFGLGLYIYAGEDLPEDIKEYVCSDCGKVVESNMAARTQKAFGVVLCKDCGIKRSEQK